MQQDISVSVSNETVELNTSEVTLSFITIDAKKANGETVANTDIDNIIAEIDAQLNEIHVNRSLNARLNAIKGLCYLLRGNTSRAESIYKDSSTLQKDDAYVIILGNRLLVDREQALADLSVMDSTNVPLFLLEQSLVLYSLERYSESVALMDKALLELPPDYRDCYNKIRDTAWQIHSLGTSITNTDKQSKVSLTDFIDVNTMITLTQNNSSLLTSFLSGTSISTKALLEKLATSGYFSAATDSKNVNGSSNDILTTKPLTRILCARFLWNLYIQKRGDESIRTKYSDRYSQRKNSTSPIPDVEISNPDFDGVIGNIENELMDLPDGEHFFPNDTVTVADYLSFLKALEK